MYCQEFPDRVRLARGWCEIWASRGGCSKSEGVDLREAETLDGMREVMETVGE
jgi:hypothetical protein